MTKPFMGRLKDWTRQECSPEYGLGWYLTCTFIDHPYFAGERGHTSWVESYDPVTKIVETRNSRYALVGEEHVMLPR